MMRAGYLGHLVNPNRSTLQWAEIGTVFCSLERTGDLDPTDLVLTRPYEDIFRDLFTVTLPAFTEQASDLLGVLEYKTKQLSEMKQRALAAGASLFFAGSQLLFRMGYHW